MLDTILKSIGASDATISAMGPTLVIMLALLGGFALTQTIKWPLGLLLATRASAMAIRYVTRLIAIGSTGVICWALDGLPWLLCAIVGFAQPVVYFCIMAAIKRFWPWLEPAVSSTPTVAGMAAQAQRAMNR